MTRRRRKSLLILPLLLAACADTDLVRTASDPRAGFAFVADGTRRATGADSVWARSAAEIAATEARVRGLVHGKTIGPDTAVQVALMNNRALQAAYAGLGLSATELWEVALGPVPTLNISLGQTGLTRSAEATIAAALIELSTQKPRKALAETRFRQAQLRALGETVALAAETRRAWIDAVAAFEAAALIAQTQATADAASELAAELGRTGAMNRGDQAREHVFTAELAAERADARLEAQLAKERLTRLMGLWGTDVSYYVPDRMPALPGRQPGRSDAERLALEHRVDLAIGRLELQAIAQHYRLSGSTRMLSDAEILAGVEVEREDEAVRARVVEVGFEIPLYDTGKLAARKGELEYMRAAHRLAQQAINARSEARSAHAAVTGQYRIARHWRDEVLPLRRVIDEEALRTYNGMLTSTFDLIADAREGLDAQLSTAEAKADYWRAEADLTAVIWGGNPKGGDE
ncbi:MULTISPECIES: TolC family protein [Mameliella]|uniref:Heavy metal resistance-like protein n=1 Tax=Mameliella alba TaxID=561184 RepID=A0A0B3RV77_9RHOB|nr:MULTISPECIES: TolC family protein [Mameliella]KHQ51997.1 Heavy metal resistance-like protein [Mameliella alba]MDD9730057.1 TolC family protein [Mameliella sp. AT18]ODM46068.1 heavy metal resistance-like protein [Ruegeria sp. PBVC088]